ncbi:unnamed protein product [Zymoseptoria tritici ST99CH_1A5]|uniref:Uncharacterized protein n=2 Tax=Zymoseptoria tritici TaxID=1047171 RepID=A0A2H1GQ56_ZYMTR|nr:unnamed protein product [Zymoseptoria tritici ST99CH_1E4]SMY26444.1 unnamed protein product [Zymoseptoria tritici ST99CH_1A5]
MAQVEENSDPKAQYITVLLAPITIADIIVLARLTTAKFHADTVAAIEADLSLSDGGMADAYVREAHLKHPESAGLPHLEEEMAKVVRGFAHQISVLTRSLVRSTLAGKDLTPEEFHTIFIGGGELAQAMEPLVNDGISRFGNGKHEQHPAAWRTANDPNTTPPMADSSQTEESQQIVSSPAWSIRQRSSVPMSGKSGRRGSIRSGPLICLRRARKRRSDHTAKMSRLLGARRSHRSQASGWARYPER